MGNTLNEKVAPKWRRPRGKGTRHERILGVDDDEETMDDVGMRVIYCMRNEQRQLMMIV